MATEIRIGTNDPSKYYSASEVFMEGSGKPLSQLMPNKRGLTNATVIPREHTIDLKQKDKKNEIYVSLGDNNGFVKIDYAKLASAKTDIADLLVESKKSSVNSQEAILKTYLHFSDKATGLDNKETKIIQNVPETVIQPEEDIKISNPVHTINPVKKEIKGIRVTFEIPRAGQMTSFYHSVICSGNSVVLIYDHSVGYYQHYVPPILENDSGLPEAMAVLINSSDNRTEKLYLCYYTGLRFTHNKEEFIIMAVEKEVVSDSGFER